VRKGILPRPVVGNEFVVPQPRLQLATPLATQPASLPAVSALDGVLFDFEQIPTGRHSLLTLAVEYFHQYSLGAFALLFLLVVGSATQVANIYTSTHLSIVPSAASSLHLPAAPLKGPNTIVSRDRLASRLQQIVEQPVSLVIAGQTVGLSPDTVKSWLQTNTHQDVSYIHVKQSAITKSLTEAAAPFVKAPVNQVSVTHPDGTASVISAGKNGIELGDITSLISQISRQLPSGQGLHITLPIKTLAFATVAPSAFDKLLEVNLTTKQMWAYEKGQLVRSFAISAGAPETPTPIGQFKIYSKLAVQDMRGYNPNGTKYFQPHVRWVNYFLPGGYAVHGNYWRPLSWFGARNSSHGCVSLPDDQAKWVYDWAPVGTTVITHA